MGTNTSTLAAKKIDEREDLPTIWLTYYAEMADISYPSEKLQLSTAVMSELASHYDIVMGSIRRWATKQAGTIDECASILYATLKEERSTIATRPEELEALNEDEKELLALADAFDIEQLNVDADLTEDEKTLLTLARKT